MRPLKALSETAFKEKFGLNEEPEPTITDYKYKVESRKTSLLMGEDLDSAVDVDGWNIDLAKYEIWSDGDIVPCERVTVTATTEENEVQYLMKVVRISVVFSFVFQLGITQTEAYEMFMKGDEER